MKICIIILACFSFGIAIGQQENADGLRCALSLSQSTELSAEKTNSIEQSFYQESDSLKNLYKNKFRQMDSTQTLLRNKLDSIRSLQSTIANGSRAKLDSIQSRMGNKLDSVSLSHQASRLTNALDSIKNLHDSTLLNLTRRIQAIKDETIGKLNSLDLPPQLKGKLSNAIENVEGYKIGTDLNPSLASTNLSLSVSGLENLNFPSTPLIEGNGLKNIKSSTDFLPDGGEKAGDYANDLKQLRSGNLDEIKDLPKAAELKVEELSGMSEVKEQTKTVDQYKEMAASMQNPDSLNGFAKQKIKQAAVNHFAGKEEQLKQAIETISKYKNKYSSLNSLADVKKGPPNEMKGKPFIERVVSGVAMQVQKKGDDFMVDFNPYAGYRFTGRIAAGVGWNQRVAYNLNSQLFDPEARVFGPRVFGEFKLWKGFSPRLEGEVMNTKLSPATLTPSLDPRQREWIWGAFVGLKKEYRFFKNIKGTALIMTRIFNPNHKSPYADILNVRFGFEFPFKKKLKNGK